MMSLAPALVALAVALGAVVAGLIGGGLLLYLGALVVARPQHQGTPRSHAPMSLMTPDEK